MMKVCPKCGGDSGHEHVLVIHNTMTGSWGDGAEATSDCRYKNAPKTVKCIDCGCRVPYAKAMGEDGLIQSTTSAASWQALRSGTQHRLPNGVR